MKREGEQNKLTEWKEKKEKKKKRKERKELKEKKGWSRPRQKHTRKTHT